MLSSHPCRSEGVLLLPSLSFIYLDAVCLEEMWSSCVFKLDAFTWPFMAVTCGR